MLHIFFIVFAKTNLGTFLCKQYILTMLTEKVQNSSKIFICERCNYNTVRESQYKRHLLTAKHKNLTNLTEKVPKGSKDILCECCNRQYKSRMGLWQHQQKCGAIVDKGDEIVHKNTPDMNVFVNILKQNEEFKELMVEQSKQIHEQQQEIQDLHKHLIHAVKHTGNTIQNQTINNTHQKFNLNFFLNEQCKDAINMSEFLENMELDMEDLTETSRLGYVGGISRILVNKLRELDTYKRPLHCTDMKRETLYIRENDEWSKEENSKEKLKEIVDKISNKNCRNIKQWTDEHPDYSIFDSPENMEYVKLTSAVLGGLGDQETRQFQEKVVKNVVKEVMINKL